MSRYIDLIGWDDCPHLKEPFITKQELDDMEKAMLPHQRSARRTGRPSLGAGAIYPVHEDEFLIDPFKIPDHWPRGYGLDVGWKKTAMILGALDQDTGVVYLTNEYYQGESMPVVHTHGIKTILPWLECQGAIDPAAKGSNQRDGQKLRLEYEDLGLRLVTADNAVHAGIHVMLTMLQTGQLKVFNTLPFWLKEQRLYRRDAKGKIVKANDHLMDATRYLLKTDGVFSTPPMQQARSSGYGEW